jgi:hypothetical protein
MKRTILLLALLVFLGLTGMALYQDGVVAIFRLAITPYAGAQVFWDLVIALSLFLVWMWKDARSVGRNPWPWILAVLATGSIGALIYLLIYKSGSAKNA